jgi:type IV pilus assembly protein PilQ
MARIVKHKALMALMALCLAALLAACADKKNQKDPFVEKWEKLAEETKDKSYQPQKRRLDVSQLQVKSEDKSAEQKPPRPLPTLRVSLNFYNTDLQAVLRSLARIANQNIILSAALQAPDNQGKLKVSLNVSETPWDQAFNSILNANGLTYDWDGEIIRVMTLEDMKAQNAMKKAIEEKMTQNAKLKAAEPMVTIKVDVNYADVMELEKTLKGYLASPQSAAGAPAAPAAGAAPAASPAAGGADDLTGKIKGQVVADKNSNSIIIQATKEHAEMLVRLVEKLDEPRLQVHLKAFIVEASRDSFFDLGFQWGGFFRSTPDGAGNRAVIMSGNNTSVDSQGVRTLTPIFGLGPASYGYAFNYPASLTPSGSGLDSPGTAVNFMWGMLSGSVLQLQLTALAREGKLNILSEPSITTLDNNMAFTENGERIPFVTVSQNGTQVQFIDAVLRLEMTPHVIDGKNVRMKLVIKNDEVINDKARWVMGNPPIRKKQTDTTLIVEDGSTIIISGLAKHSNEEGEQGFPGLKDIPGAGYLFKSANKNKAKQDILVFITPTVLKAQAENAPSPGQPAQPGRPGSPDRQPIPLGPAPAAPQTGRAGG